MGIIRFNIWYYFISVILLFSFVSVNLAKSQANEIYGVKFASYEVKKDLRTSLNLTPIKPLETKGSFSLSFDFKYYRDQNAYGYIFRLIANNSVNFDFISKTYSFQNNDLEFVIGQLNTNIYYYLNEIVDDPLNDWIHTVIQFDKEAGTISFNMNGIVKTNTIDIKYIKDIRILFGANNNSRFSTSDVPPIIVKDVKFQVRGGNNIFWKLNQSGTKPVVDQNGKNKADIINPIWVIDDHSRWKRISALTTKKFPQIAFNSHDSRAYIVEDDRIHIVYLTDRKAVG